MFVIYQVVLHYVHDSSVEAYVQTHTFIWLNHIDAEQTSEACVRRSHRSFPFLPRSGTERFQLAGFSFQSQTLRPRFHVDVPRRPEHREHGDAGRQPEEEGEEDQDHTLGAHS